MTEMIKKVFFDEMEGLNGRFRDGDYTVLPEERKVIDEYFDSVCAQLDQKGEIDAENFSIVMKIVETCEGTMNSDVLDMVQSIYWKFDQLNINKQGN